MNLYFRLIPLLFFAVTLQAQENLSLSQAIEKGLENNYQIQVAERQTGIAKNNNNYAAAGRYPTVDFILSANNSLTRQDNPVSFINGSYLSSGITGTVDLAWTLFDGFKVRINKSRLEELEQQGKGNEKVMIENTIRQILLAYNQVLIQQEQLGVLGEVLGLSRDRVAYQEVRREFGQAGTFDVLQTNDAFLNDSTNLLIQRQSYATAVRNLNLAMGEDDFGKLYTFTDPLVYDPAPYDLEALQQQMLTSNIDLRQLHYSLNLAAIDRELQESNRAPRVSANTGLSGSGNLFKLFGDNPNTGEPYPSQSGNNLNYYLNLSASYRLYDSGARKRAIQNAQVQESIVRLNIEDLKRSLSLQLRNTLETYQHQLQLLQLSETLVDNARKNLEISEERFRAGQISSFDYRSVQLSYISASQSRLNSIFNLKNTETDLIQLTGGLVK